MARRLPDLPDVQYYPLTTEPPEGARYLTLAEAEAMECNGCGDCCSSLQHPSPRVWSFGPIPRDQHAEFNGGKPLIIPLSLKTSQPRAWRATDEAGRGPFDCDALLPPNTRGQRFCRLWDPSNPHTRPQPCDEFPLGGRNFAQTLAKGYMALIPAIYQRRCTWTDSILVPDDWSLMPWRRRDRTLRPLPEDLQDLINRAYELLILESLYEEAPKRGEWYRLMKRMNRLAAERLAGRRRAV